MTDTVTRPKTKVRTKTERPRLHKVILVNDDFTPREFVVSVLKAEFRMTEDEAHKVMITAHRLGVCVVAVFTKDVAETKATRATDAPGAKVSSTIWSFSSGLRWCRFLSGSGLREETDSFVAGLEVSIYFSKGDTIKVSTWRMPTYSRFVETA